MLDSEILSAKQRFGIIGNSPSLNHAIQVAIQVAPTDMTVLITGESGSGKESFSKIIHSLSSRKHGQFIAINCGAIPEGTIDSELFGHEKGAFTGANDTRKGYFEVTNGGTIFLDEVGEMPLGTQARLLRVLENGEYIRVGSSKVLKTDVRVVAATNVKLLEAVSKGKFREDLYYRLNTVPIYVPPLRERGNDIDLLFRKFSYDFSEKYRTEPVILDAEAKQVLVNYRFPGNIRQLRNLVDQISVLEMSRNIDKNTLLKYLPNYNKHSSNLPALASSEDEKENFSERDLLYKVLFDMKKDMTELKKLVLDLMQGNNINHEVMENYEGLFNSLQLSAPSSVPTTPSTPPSSVSTNIQESQPTILNNDTVYIQPETTNNFHEPVIENKVQDISHEEEMESLSLEEKEKEFIVKALKKHKNKRKAAQELGISERTLYRKINQYDIKNI